MQLRIAPWIMSAVCCAAAVAQEGWRDLKGEVVPEISARNWLNTGGAEPNRESLKGKVWLLMFFQTYSSMSSKKVTELSELHDKYFDKGFRVVAISDESRSRLQSRLIEERNATYWIGSDPERDTKDRFVNSDLISMPRYYLVDAVGRVVGHDIPSPKRIEELLQAVFQVELDRELPPELETAAEAYRGGNYGYAYQQALKATSSKKAAVAAEAGVLRDKVVEYAEFLQRSLPIELQGYSPEAEYGKLLVVAEQFEGLEIEKWARERMEVLEDNDAIKKERRAWSKLLKAVQRDLAARGRPYELERAKKLYEDVVKKHRFSGVPSRLAAKRLEGIEQQLAK